MIPLKVFQFSIILEDLYLVILPLQSLFYHALECLVILIHQENLHQTDSEILVYS